MARIVDFLDALTTDEELEASFEKNPREAMLGYGLTDEQALIVYAGSLDDLRNAVQGEVSDGPIIIMGRTSRTSRRG